MTGVISAPAGRVPEFSLDRYVALRGLVTREAITQQLDRSRRSSIIELRGGAGWGKTSAALTYAVQRQASGTQVILFQADAGTRICPAPGQDEVLYVIDDCSVSDEIAQELLSRVQEDSSVQIIVCSRERHPIVERALSNGLLCRKIHLADWRITARDIVEICRLRGVQLDTPRAEYVAHAVGGWPIVATGFIDLYADGTRDSSVASIDQLITRSFDAVLNRLLPDALPLLAKAALADGFRPEQAENAAESQALHTLIDRVAELGLGEWVMA